MMFKKNHLYKSTVTGKVILCTKDSSFESKTNEIMRSWQGTVIFSPPGRESHQLHFHDLPGHTSDSWVASNSYWIDLGLVGDDDDNNDDIDNIDSEII